MINKVDNGNYYSIIFIDKKEICWKIIMPFSVRLDEILICIDKQHKLGDKND